MAASSPLRKSGATGPRKSHYVCEHCKIIIAAVEVDPGTIPAAVECITKGCDGPLRSCFYNDLPAGSPEIPVTHEFYRKKGPQLVHLLMNGGVGWLYRNGRLELRERTSKKPLRYEDNLTSKDVEADIKEALEEGNLGLVKASGKRFIFKKRLALGGK